MSLAAFECWIFAILFEENSLDIETLMMNDNYLKAIWLGFGPGFLGQVIFTWMMGYVSALVVSIFMTFEPIYGTIIGICYGLITSIDNYTIIGGLIMVSGCIFAN